MNYRRTNRSNKPTGKIIATVCIILIALRIIVPHAFSALFVDIFAPFWIVENHISRGAVSQNQIVFSDDSLFASGTIAELADENASLKNMLGRPESENSVLADVISRPPFAAYDTIIVDAGFDNGVAVGDKVFALAYPVVYSVASDTPPSATNDAASSTFTATSTTFTKDELKQLKAVGTVSLIASSSSDTDLSQASTTPSVVEIPIGQVAAVYGSTALVSLFSSPGGTYPVEIGLYRIAASAIAQGSGMFEAMVPNNSNIVAGDPVIMPDIQAGVFASVVSVVSDPARPYSLVIFQSPVDPFSLSFVSIEKADETK